ncbi:hypothetical protein ADK67_40280 [Saccharothrix sp. NRRL B-16348]|nr:hypothetical protein ADK67_40280 [Saccharothrix sp. NRRL B-16348]
MVVGAERDCLRSSFGVLLRSERHVAGLSQPQLAERASTTPFGISRLENGHVRPSTGMCWRLARALRHGLDDRAAVALDLRLRVAAGPSLRSFSTRTHRQRERLAAELLADGLPISGADDFTNVVLSLLVGAS